MVSTMQLAVQIAIVICLMQREIKEASSLKHVHATPSNMIFAVMSNEYIGLLRVHTFAHCLTSSMHTLLLQAADVNLAKLNHSTVGSNMLYML
jgi:hypothetical protein